MSPKGARLYRTVGRWHFYAGLFALDRLVLPLWPRAQRWLDRTA